MDNPQYIPLPTVFEPLHWRQFELTVEDCLAFQAKNIYHFTGQRHLLSVMDWAAIGIDLRLWIQGPRFALIMELFGFGDPADLEKMRDYLEGLMEGRQVVGVKVYKGGAPRKNEAQRA